MAVDRQTIGDTGFAGVDAQSAPHLVEAGFASDALNKDFRDRSAATRRALHTVLFAVRKTMPFDGYVMPYAFTGKKGLGTVFGSGEFSDPDGYEYAVIAAASGSWLLQVNSEPILLPLPIDDSGNDDAVVLKQAFNQMLMFRGEAKYPLVIDPINDARWQHVTQTAVRGADDDNSYGDGTEPIPAGHTATVFGNRVFVGVGRDEIAVSDILDFTRYSRAYNRFFINEGSDDYLVRIYPFNQTTLLPFKNQSIYLLGNVYGDLTDVRCDVLTFERGCIAAGTIVTVGKDIWFLSEGGVYSIGQVLDNKLQAGSVPVSAPIQPIFDRINWSAAHKAQAVVHDNRYLLAVPLDGAQYNNALLVYDFIRKAWAGVWKHDLLDVNSFIRLSSPSGQRDLYIVSGNSMADETAHGAVWKFGTGFTDDFFGTEMQISDSLTTRGYGPPVRGGKFLRLELVQSTWNPKFTIELIPDGIGEEQTLMSNETKPRSESYVFSANPCDELNANGLHGAPYRKDYSVQLPGDDALDLDDFDFDGYVFQRGLIGGADPAQHQTARERFAVKAQDRMVQVRIRNTQGRAVQRMVFTEMVDGRVQTGTQV